MAYKVDTPIVNTQINRWRISQLLISTPVSGNNYISLVIGIGYNNGVDDTVWYSSKTYSARGAEFDAIVSMQAVGITLFDVIKRATYNYALSQGWIANDAVEE
jgi:hypothetical protein